MGVGSNSNWYFGSRAVNGSGIMSNVSIDNNSMSNISTSVKILSEKETVECTLNTNEGLAVNNPKCTPLEFTPKVTGASY